MLTLTLTQTFTHNTGFHITPFEMEGVGFIFLPKEIEGQLDYENLPDMVRQSDSFDEGIEYIILRSSKLLELKALLKKRNTIPEVSNSINRAPSLIVLTEPGLYTVMFLSRKQKAKSFRRWVTCEVLPTIRKTGEYKVTQSKTEISDLNAKIDHLQRTFIDFAIILNNQEQFRDYAVGSFERIEGVLAESLPHDMFEGWRKIKKIVDDMTKIYGLSQIERKRYIRELCKCHDVHLPEKAFIDNDPPFHDLQEIAIKIGLYSSTDKPHSRLVAALIRYLNLNCDEYCYKHGSTPKYSENVIPHIVTWLQQQKYPDTIKLSYKENAKIRSFRVKYQTI